MRRAPVLRRRVRAHSIHWRHAVRPWAPAAGTVQWLFVATFANGGSTAFAKTLASARAAIMLHQDGEAQWLVPQLAEGGQRYDPGIAVNWGKVRAIWLNEVRRQAPGPCVVVEKSPPNLVRMRPLMGAFADMPRTLLRLTRDPYAVCSSWAGRYRPEHLATAWGEADAGVEPGSLPFYELLGRMYGRRAEAMLGLADITDLTLRYEDLTSDPAEALVPLRARIPMLAEVEPGAVVQVKDYAPQRLVNMNPGQIGRMSADQIDAITTGLAPFAQAIGALGYGLR